MRLHTGYNLDHPLSRIRLRVGNGDVWTYEYRQTGGTDSKTATSLKMANTITCTATLAAKSQLNGRYILLTYLFIYDLMTPKVAQHTQCDITGLSEHSKYRKCIESLRALIRKTTMYQSGYWRARRLLVATFIKELRTN